MPFSLCKNINSVEMDFNFNFFSNDILFAIISQSLPLNGFTIHFIESNKNIVNYKYFNNFFAKYGNQLATIGIRVTTKRLKTNYFVEKVKSCENLLKIMTNNSLFWPLFCVENEIHFKKLHAIEMTEPNRQ